MRNLVAAVAVLSVVVSPSFAQSGRNGNAHSAVARRADSALEKTILDLEAKRIGAMVHKDLVTLDALLADDLTYTHSGGTTDTKASFIALIKDRGRYLGVDYSNTQVIPGGGNTVLVRGLAKIRLEDTAPYTVIFADVWVLRDGTWKMVAWQATRERSADTTSLSTANDVRSGMPADVAKQLAAFGTEFDGDIAAATAKIYASQPHVYQPGDIKVVKNLAYGPHERQQLDIHTSTVRKSAGLAPVIVVFHGGGLIGGSRTATVNVADYFASLGYVGVNSGYRLAPDSKWPEGARDVGAAVTWLKDHAREYGGNPEQIFVIGLSTGAYHAATYVFRPELLLPGTARAAGAMLVSGPYSFDFASPSKGELVYFGEDRTRWPEMVIPGHVTRADIPVLFTTAEWDNARYLWPEAALYKELVDKGARPRYKQSPGHNHSSQLWSLGTSDTSVSRELVDFIERTVKH